MYSMQCHSMSSDVVIFYNVCGMQGDKKQNLWVFKWNFRNKNPKKADKN